MERGACGRLKPGRQGKKVGKSASAKIERAEDDGMGACYDLEFDQSSGRSLSKNARLSQEPQSLHIEISFFKRFVDWRFRRERILQELDRAFLYSMLQVS